LVGRAANVLPLGECPDDSSKPLFCSKLRRTEPKPVLDSTSTFRVSGLERGQSLLLIPLKNPRFWREAFRSQERERVKRD
jgi:hypothetical protein